MNNAVPLKGVFWRIQTGVNIFAKYCELKEAKIDGELYFAYVQHDNLQPYKLVRPDGNMEDLKAVEDAGWRWRNNRWELYIEDINA